MGVTEAVRIGMATRGDLFAAFVDQVLGRGNSRFDVDSLNNKQCWLDIENRQTQFFLNPWEDHVCAGSDLVVWLTLAFIVLVINWTVRWTIYEPLADARMKGRSKTWDRATCRKFSETMTCNVFFIISTFFGFRVIYTKPWSTNPSLWTSTIDDWSIPADYKFFYLLYLGRFTSDLVSIFFEDRPRKTFLISLLHHSLTIILVFNTALGNFNEFAGIVMFLLDMADPFLMTAKCCRYLALEPDGVLMKISERLFEVFAVVFILTRGVGFNIVVYHIWKDGPNSAIGISGKVLITCMSGMQIYWIGLIIKAAMIKKKTGKLEDLQNKKSD